MELSWKFSTFILTSISARQNFVQVIHASTVYASWTWMAKEMIFSPSLAVKLLFIHDSTLVNTVPESKIPTNWNHWINLRSYSSEPLLGIENPRQLKLHWFTTFIACWKSGWKMLITWFMVEYFQYDLWNFALMLDQL